MSLALLNRNPVTWDSEAAIHLTSVESADSQSLEPTVARAINSFVIDCKIRGIWGAIKSCCLLSGARTLNGALVPLKGVAPTNNNFVSSDYNRETGLKGNGSNKYLDSNRAGTSDPADNTHCSVYVSSPGTGATAYIGQNGFTTGASSIGTDTGGPNYLFFSLKTGNSNISGFTTIVGVTGALGLIGMSKNNNNNFNYRFNSKTGIANIAATTVGSGNWEIFGRGGASRLPTNARLSFYSIGENIDLRLLEQCVNNFNLNLLYALRYNSSDSDVQNYLSRVEAADNYPLENSVRLAIHNFVTGCKSDNIWNSIKASCIMMGARTLTGALVPLVGNSPGNFNFLSSDYDRKTGLKGNASNKYLNSNRANNADGQNDQHLSVYMSSTASPLAAYIGAGGTGNGASGLSKSAGGGQPGCRSRNGTGLILGSTSTTGLFGISRSISSSYDVYNPDLSSLSTLTQDSQTPSSDNIYVFARNNGSNSPEVFSDGRLAFYSIGSGLSLSLLNTRVTTLYNTINSNF